eukprot:s313_g14.t1
MPGRKASLDRSRSPRRKGDDKKEENLPIDVEVLNAVSGRQLCGRQLLLGCKLLSDHEILKHLFSDSSERTTLELRFLALRMVRVMEGIPMSVLPIAISKEDLCSKAIALQAGVVRELLWVSLLGKSCNCLQAIRSRTLP